MEAIGKGEGFIDPWIEWGPDGVGVAIVSPHTHQEIRKVSIANFAVLHEIMPVADIIEILPNQDRKNVLVVQFPCTVPNEQLTFTEIHHKI